mgnify:CR=1 FL=1
MNLDLLTWTLVVLLGLAIGSFLNVVIHRLPRMMAAQWAAEVAAEAPSLETEQPLPQNRYNIAVPSSHCPHCGQPDPVFQEGTRRGMADIPLARFSQCAAGDLAAQVARLTDRKR